jgi:glutamate-1-semialdehyde 2,1-aminomutase
MMAPGRHRTRIAGDAFGAFALPDEVSFVVARAAEGRLESTAGRSYVDHVLGSGPMVLGHSRPEVNEALRRQIDRGTTSYLLNEPAIRLADKINQLVPCAESVKLVGDGASATFYALRLARAYTGRERILKFDGGYHGYHDYSVSTGDACLPASAADGRRAECLRAGIPRAVAETVLSAPFNDLDATREIVYRHRDDIAAIIVEPVQRAVLSAPGFLQGLRGLATETGSILIFDELVTGFRLALGGAQEAEKVTPDLCALGKILGGGLPLAAVAGPEEMLSLATPGAESASSHAFISGTFNGNPLAAVAGLATLTVLEETDALRQVHSAGQVIKHEFARLAEKHSIALQMIGPDPFPEPVFGREPVTDYASYLRTDRAAARRFGIELIRRGVFVNPGAKMYLSSAHTDADLEQTVAAADEALKFMTAAGLFDRPEEEHAPTGGPRP